MCASQTSDPGKSDQYPNVDNAEIAKFDKVASRWWDPEGEFKPLHQMNPVRANFIDRFASVAGKKVLDVGCGGGLLSEAMAQRGALVTGIDMGAVPLDIAQLHAQANALEITYLQSTAEQHAATNKGAYDVVCCLELLEHVPDPDSVIRACAELAKPGGQVFFSTLNRTPMAYLMAVVGAEYLANILPRGTHDYKKFITPAELASACRAAGLQVLHLAGLSYNPITNCFRETNQVAINYIIHAEKTA